MARQRRLLFSLPAIVLFCSILGGVYVPRAQVAAAAGPAAAEAPALPADMGLFTKALVLVEQHYADRLDSDKAIYQGALPGMMRTLDPHSNFLIRKSTPCCAKTRRATISEWEWK
jgi:carboxyl-terminal processing protease